MQEEPYGCVWLALSKHLRHQQQMVVVDPHKVASLVDIRNGIRKRFVYGYVSSPVARLIPTVSRLIPQNVMKEGP